MPRRPDFISVIQSQVLSFSEEDFEKAKAWPFEEARKILTRLQGKTPKKGYVLLETGYGPSGLPHIGTFGEVARTVMVQHALDLSSSIPTRLFAFSDDMDGFRKVPDNVPNQAMLAQHLGKPLTSVPDPYGKYESFGHHNNAKLREFLDSFGFHYEFKSATEHYQSGAFDAMLLAVLAHYDEIMAIVLPTLRDERRATYSPFLPIHPQTQQVLQVPTVERYLEAGTIVYRDPGTHKLLETPVTGGHCKLQWKVDWSGRWFAFDVDYEMSGKDLISSVELSSRICKVLGGHPPEGLCYELFLDQEGQKVSKSKGNGLSLEEWLRYAPQESLAYYMFQAPKRAKRLYFDVIPKAVDEYIAWLSRFESQEALQKLDNPIFHIHQGNPPDAHDVLSFNILLNLASVCGTESAEVLWGFVQKYLPQATPECAPFLDRLIHHSLMYFQDFIKPNLSYRAPTTLEKTAMVDLLEALQEATQAIEEGEAPSPESLQQVVFEVGKKYPFSNLQQWFQSLYEILLGNSQGPRMGSFIALYGVENMCALIMQKLAGEETAEETG
ncbi:lysine--tRNA ligase [Alphaproteobacteria bacterium]|nr:lysine--tRNA ligase [Alphaproteobacteria bacterium]GHS97748.1 lysine--tRNA ligase [Alphaproteobacteria bacterium]